MTSKTFDFALHGKRVLYYELKLMLNQIKGDDVYRFSYDSVPGLSILIKRKNRTRDKLRDNVDKLDRKIRNNTEPLDNADMTALLTLYRDNVAALVLVEDHISRANALVEAIEVNDFLRLADDALSD